MTRLARSRSPNNNGSEIWGFKEDKELERIELWFLRSILHLPNSAVGMAVRGELGQLPLYLWWKERILGTDYVWVISPQYYVTQHVSHCSMQNVENKVGLRM